MNKASNASIGKRLLMLLLSVAMVITMMPLASVASYADDEATPITSAEEFAAMDAAGSYVLANDITVTEPYATQFTGTFDGDGHTVTLAIESAAANTGLFKQLSGAHVSNVNTEGSVSSSANYVAAIAGEATGGAIIENCMNSASVTGTKGNAGGIVGRAYNGVTITNCYNGGAIEGSANRVGGISGYNSGGEVTIDGCVNTGSVTGTNNQIGGITGNVSGGTTTISNSYNAGTVTGTGQYSNMAGGIIGQTAKSGPTDNLVNCYNVGTVSFSESTNTNLGALIGNKSNNGTVTNCYFLEGSAAVAVGGATVEGAASKTAEEMQADAFVTALNGEGDAFVKDTNGINGGYPVLSWQGGGSVEPEVPVPVTAVTIEGEAKTGETLTAIATGADGAEPTNVTYQWQYEDSEWDDDEWDYVTSYVNIEGATGKTYTIAADMAGKKLRVVASGDEESSATSDLTATVAKGDDALVAEAAKALTNPFAEEYKEDAQVTLPATGKNNTTITWESSDSAVISNDGKVTLPETGISEVTMTATISLNEQSTTKEFKVSVISEESQQNPPDATVIKDIVKKFDSIYTLRPSYGKDTNINDFAAAQIKAFTGIQGFDPAKVSVALKSSDKPETIAADGTINYVQKDTPDQYGMNSVNVSCEFTITYGEATADTSKKTASIGWDREAFQARMQAEADGLTIDKILGENESAEAVTKDLSLPQCMGTSARQVWSVITWTSSNENVISFKEEPYSGITTPLKGVVNPAADDTEVTLTATFKANDTILNTNLENVGDFETITKEFKVTVPGTGQQGPTEEELLEILNTYYKDSDLKYSEDGAGELDLNAVTGDIQLPLYTRIKDENGDLVFANKEITVTSSDESVIKINGYRANVDRFQSENKTVDLTVSFTRAGITVSKVIKVTVDAITDAELDAELAAMETVKEHYFDGINDGTYESKDAITGNLHAFQEANVGEDGKISWVYNKDDETGAGIIADGYWGEGQSEEMEASGYNRFKSSDPSVIQHENLVVAVPEKSKQVVITSWLSSAKYGKYAPAHPDNEKLQKLYKQEVSATVTVKGKSDGPVEPDEPVEPADPADVTLTVSNQGTIAKAKDGSAMVEKEVTVTDLDKDGHLTYDEALVAAHEEYFDGGKAGYATGMSQYGAYVTKMWGVSTSGFLFFIDGTGISTGVKDDEVVEGDNLYAASLKDETMGADWYTMFDKTELAVKEGTEITLVLNGHLGMAYMPEDLADAPVAGAQIGVWKDGAFEAIDGAVTDADGKVTFTMPEGEYLLTATGTVKDDVYDWATQSTVETDCPIMAPYCTMEVSKDNMLEQIKQDVMESLQDEVDLSRYNTEEQVQILSALVKAQAEIAAAGSSDEVNSIVESFRAQVAEVATKQGWSKEDGEWYYYKDGEKLTNGWVKANAGWCWMDANGKWTKGRWIKDSGSWYYIKPDGYMAANQWVKASGGWCYVSASGRMVTNGWVKDSKGWCWMGSDGYWVKNRWIQDKGTWYYIKSDGYMASSQWVKSGSQWCYLKASGAMAAGEWVEVGGSWYYLKANGYMATGTQTINGKTYRFDASGKWIQ